MHSFHSLGLAILGAHGEALGFQAGLRIADETERRGLLASAMGVSEARAGRLLKAVSVLKRQGAAGEGEAAEALALMRRIGRERGFVDFDDLVGLAVELLAARPDIAALWRGRFAHVLADEFQDVDEQQYRLLRLIAGEAGNLCVIGDPDQAIYGFRGADSTCFSRFAADYPAAATVRLARNYRSDGAIVAAASAVIGKADALPMRPRREPIRLHVAPDERAEAAFVAAEIERLIGGHDLLVAGRAAGALSFADFAVLYRTDAQAAALREALDRAGIPFKKSSPAPIAGEAAVRAVLAALEREPEGDLGGRLARAVAAARADTEPAALAEAKRWLMTLATSAGDEAALRAEAALATEADFWDARADRVSLMTMHGAKGLEFPVVFVVGVEDGIVPFRFGAEEDAASEAEERRLFYVAMTRARDRLILTRAAERGWRGGLRRLPPSPYLAALDAGLIATAEARPKPAPKPKQYSLF